MTAGYTSPAPNGAALRNHALLFLAGNPNSVARSVAEAVGLPVADAKSLLRSLASRGEVTSTRGPNDYNRQRVYLWNLAPQEGMTRRILDALDAPRMVWGVARSIGVPEAQTERALVLLAYDGIVRQSGEMWARA